MAETYKKIDKDTLEITSTNIYQRERERLEEEKQMVEQDAIRIKKRIDKINIKLAVLDDAPNSIPS